MRATTVVVGAGHAGLATSHCLAALGIDHVVIERGEVGHSWRTERWDSLRLLTPNWLTRLPGLAYDGDDPDGYMDMSGVVAFLERYARLEGAPVETRTTVESVTGGDGGYDVVTDRGAWRCRTVVVASGACNLAKVPPCAASLPGTIESVTAMEYTKPSDLPDGGVLVVGASATGVQIAGEIRLSGRPVTLAVGEHVRMPRRYRGRDILWWLERTGLHDERWDEVDDIVRARRVPSPQLVGDSSRSALDLNALAGRGVRLVGRLAGVSDARAHFSGSLRNTCALADLKQGRLLATIDEWIAENGPDGIPEPPDRPRPTRVEDSPALTLDLGPGGIRTVVWATGYEADHSWLHLPVFDHRRRLKHDGGVVRGSPGLYRIGLNFLRRRKSSFIHGAEDDARDLTDHLARHVAASRAPRSTYQLPISAACAIETPAPVMASMAPASEPSRSMARQASSTRTASNPSFTASSAVHATQKSVARPARKRRRNPRSRR